MLYSSIFIFIEFMKSYDGAVVYSSSKAPV